MENKALFILYPSPIQVTEFLPSWGGIILVQAFIIFQNMTKKT
jgi:hypothetical protein